MSRPGGSSPGRTSRWRELALLAAALLTSAALGEAYLRLFNPIDSLLFEMHPRYLYRLIPGARRLFFREDEHGVTRILLTINSAGFRGPELRRPRRTPRIVVYGDSFVMAKLTPLGETFPAQLARKIEDAVYVPVEAVNAGVVGYGPDQECLRIEDEIEPLAPDLLVVAIYAGNDFGDLVRDKIFRLTSAGGLRLNRYSLDYSTMANFPDQPRSAPWSMLWRGIEYLPRPAELGRRSHTSSPFATKGQIRSYLDKAREEYEDFVVNGNDKVLNLFGDTYDAAVNLTPETPWARYSRGVMEQVLVRIEEVARAHGVPVLLVFIPSAYDVFEGPRGAAWARAARRVSPAYRPEALTNVLDDIAERHGFEYVDLFRPFRDARAERLYIPDDYHWNGAGQALAAELVRNKIIADGMMRY